MVYCFFGTLNDLQNVQGIGMSEEEILKYKDSLKGCKCNSWCRVDLSSGFNSIHHSGCNRFNWLKEIHIFSISNMNKFHEIQSLKAQNEKLEYKVKRYWTDVEYLEKIEAQNKKLRECAEFYRDEKYLKEATSSNAVDYYSTYRFDIDGGKKAQECLKEIDNK